MSDEVTSGITLPALAGPPIPDIEVCNRVYGENIQYRDCSDMLILFLREPARRQYPYVTSYGTCHARLDIGGPNPPTSSIPQLSISPEDFGNMARWVVSRCVVGANGSGGFVTRSLRNLVDYSMRSVMPRLPYAFPPTSSFYTVTVTDGRPNTQLFQPGNFDPAIPLTVANYANVFVTNAPTADTFRTSIYSAIAGAWTAQAAQMRPGGRGMPWWQRSGNPASDDLMTYECDAGLGSPLEADCAQIQWGQLGLSTATDGDTLTVGPGQVSLYHQNTCTLAISAAVTLVLSWAQIRTALSTLMSVCVQNPTHPARGGRAFYGAPPKQVSGSGGGRKRKGRRRRRQNELSGWNALSPHANLTIFQQSEPWAGSSVKEIETCTWKAVTQGRAVGSCHSK